MEQQYDVIVVLGAQIVRKEDGLVIPAYHTELRARAAGIAYQQGITSRFIVSGGFNVGVRYDFEMNAVFAKPNFSFEAFALARRRGPSEAQIIAQVMQEEYGVPSAAILLEDLSATTQENALFVRQILSRSLAEGVDGTDLSRMKPIGLLTLLYHMSRALDTFRSAGMEVEPVYAEDVLALDASRNWAEEVARYYETPKGGKQWAESIRKIMTARSQGDSSRTVAKLLKEESV